MNGTASHFRRPEEQPFTRVERDRVTILIGGLTRCQDRLIQAGLEGLGYRVEIIPVPTKDDFQAGREYGNNGQCNPTYFMVGALVNFLKRKRDEEGVARERILGDYVFVTAGSCGPCRFGMYEAEYRLALRNAGFDGFRVLLLEQARGIAHGEAGAGLEFNPRLLMKVINAIFIGDLLNALVYHIRPYELVPGSTNAAHERCVEICAAAMRGSGDEPPRPGLLAHLLSRTAGGYAPLDVQRFLQQLWGRHYVDALSRCREIFAAEVEVDYTRPRPVVKITGEFWAQTTEGDGNFHMFRFLEDEGAEVLVEPIATWIDYLLHSAHQALRDRRGLVPYARYWRRRLTLRAGEWLLAREYERMRQALGGSVHPLAEQPELRRVGHPYYNSRATGGEGYLEVAKNIYYFQRDLAHMTLSLKPFGCMPSTQSDGAQAAVIARYPELIYLPIETSGEGDINAYSRVQMALGEARTRCRDEFQAAVARSGHALEDIRAYVARHPELRRPLLAVPPVAGVIGRAALFVRHVGALMDRDPHWRAQGRAGSAHGRSEASA